MTFLQKIESNVELQMWLSEMLFKLLWKDKCWHEWDRYTIQTGMVRCGLCGHRQSGVFVNPNLFSSWEGFGKVWEAVKDRGDFKKITSSFWSKGVYYPARRWGIPLDYISSPYFQLEVLKWLLEQEGRLGELEEKMREVGE